LAYYSLKFNSSIIFLHYNIRGLKLKEKYYIIIEKYLDGKRYGNV